MAGKWSSAYHELEFLFAGPCHRWCVKTTWRSLACVCANDSRITIFTDVTVTGSTVGATHESGELSPGYNGQHSIWYAWSPATNGTFVVSTAGSGYDTMLGFYTNITGLLSAAVQVRGNGRT